VSDLVSEKRGWSKNLFQTFGAIETVEVTLDRVVSLVCSKG